MEKNWKHEKDHGYVIAGKSVGHLFFSSEWQIAVDVFCELNTGEIKLFTSREVKSRGIDKICEKLNNL